MSDDPAFGTTNQLGQVYDGCGNTDAYGQPLELGRLPSDLLALTDPRLMVLDARHLPEDVEDWQAFVAGEGS